MNTNDFSKAKWNFLKFAEDSSKNSDFVPFPVRKGFCKSLVFQQLPTQLLPMKSAEAKV
ncbi:MAG: hypothetical protein ACK4VW_02530 [Anaerolineales bacterium]